MSLVFPDEFLTGTRLSEMAVKMRIARSIGQRHITEYLFTSLIDILLPGFLLQREGLCLLWLTGMQYTISLLTTQVSISKNLLEFCIPARVFGHKKAPADPQRKAWGQARTERSVGNHRRLLEHLIADAA